MSFDQWALTSNALYQYQFRAKIICCRSCPYHAVKKNLNCHSKHSPSQNSPSDDAVFQLKFKAQNLNLP